MTIAKRIIAIALTSLLCSTPSVFANEELNIGFNLELSGWMAQVGQTSKNAAELVREKYNAAGGFKLDGTVYDLNFIYGDNTSDPSKASALAIDLISKNRVLGIIGPQSSSHAIPVAQMANSFSTPMISAWSTSPKTTKDRPFVFRSCFVYTIQGPVLTQFAANQFNATKAAVLYDIVAAYPRGMAKYFRDSFESINGAGSVVSFEEFRSGDTDFSKQLQRIKDSGAQMIFSPQHYNEIPLIVRQAKEMGLNIPIVGSNSWAGGDLVGECGEDCDGLFFSGNYAPGGATGVNKEFVDAYQAAYGQLPDEPAALTWDAVNVFLEAVKKTGKLTGNLLEDRKAIRKNIVDIKDFEGATGSMSFNETGNPEKCAVVVKIENGVFMHHDRVCL